jgi:tetratricopeptide (TPR) repeat protein
MQLGRYAEAEPLIVAAIEVMGGGESARAEAWCRVYYARLLRLKGSLDEAEREALRAAEVGKVAAPVVAVALTELAATLLARGHIEDAIDPARRALALLDSVEEGESLIRRVAIEAMIAHGAIAEAAELITASARRVEERGASIRDAELRASFFENVEDNRWLLDKDKAKSQAD